MTLMGYRRAVAAMAVVVVVLTVLSGALCSRWALLNLRVKLAEEQVGIFEAMRSRAVLAGPAEAAGCLGYAVWYYPSGTKQVAGSPLDRMVEQARAAAAREIIAHLRATTGEDLGSGAEPWVGKYAGQATRGPHRE